MNEILSNPTIRWAFSGVGGAILWSIVCGIGGLVVRCIYLFFKRKKKNKSCIINQSQVTGDNSQATQIGNIHYGDK